jgi:DNA polymerase-3 subunit gamma/tau
MATDINKLLINVCEKEKIKYTIEAIETIGQLANGSARDSLSILDQVAIYTNNNITIADIHKIYGIIDNETIIKFLNLFITNEKTKVFQNLNVFIQSGINFSFFIKMLADLLTDKLIYLETNNKELLSKTTKESINHLLINDKSRLIKLLDI